MSPSPPERDMQIDLICVDIPFSAEQLFHIQIGGSARGEPRPEAVTKRDPISRSVRLGALPAAGPTLGA